MDSVQFWIQFGNRQKYTRTHKVVILTAAVPEICEI